MSLPILNLLFIILEYGFEYFSPVALEAINNLIEAIENKIIEDDSNHKWVILLDEVQLMSNQYDFSGLKQSKDIHVFISFNPTLLGTFSTKLDFVPPSGEATMIEQLKSKHRNSTEISIFVLHYVKYNEHKDHQSMDDSAVLPLMESTFPSGKLPVLVRVTDSLDDTIVLQFIKSHLPSNAKSVILIYGYSLKETITERMDTISKFCQLEQWKVLYEYDIAGIEADVVICYECEEWEAFEYLSRAKIYLMILEKYDLDQRLIFKIHLLIFQL